MRPIDADYLLNFIKLNEIVVAPREQTVRDIVTIIKTAPTIEVPPNDPLTLEELWEMDGEPVWWEDKYERAGYGIVSISEFGKVIYIVTVNGTFVAIAHGEMNKHLGLTLFRRKPEEG